MTETMQIIFAYAREKRIPGYLDTHTASAAAVGGFQHNRITDPRRNLHDLVQAPYRMVHAGNNRHIALNRHFFRRNLIAHRIHAG